MPPHGCGGRRACPGPGRMPASVLRSGGAVSARPRSRTTGAHQRRRRGLRLDVAGAGWLVLPLRRCMQQGRLHRPTAAQLDRRKSNG
jgi:hypothetical protein